MNYKISILLIVIFLGFFLVGCDSRKSEMVFESFGEVKVNNKSKIQKEFNINKELEYKNWPVEALKKVIAGSSPGYYFYADNSNSKRWNFASFSMNPEKEYFVEESGSKFKKKFILNDLDLYLLKNYKFNDKSLQFHIVNVKDGLTGKTSKYYEQPELILNLTLFEDDIVATISSFVDKNNYGGGSTNYPLYISEDVDYEKNNKVIINFSNEDRYFNNNIELPSLTIEIDLSEPLEDGRSKESPDFPARIILDNKFDNSGWITKVNYTFFNFNKNNDFINLDDYNSNLMSKIQ